MPNASHSPRSAVNSNRGETIGTHRVTIDLPERSYQSLRNLVDSGEYASESDIILELVAGMEGHPEMTQEDFKAWMLEDVLPAVDEFDADPSSGFTSEQLTVYLAEARRNRPDPS